MFHILTFIFLGCAQRRPDTQEAASWFMEACITGIQEASVNLALLLSKGSVLSFRSLDGISQYTVHDAIVWLGQYSSETDMTDSTRDKLDNILLRLKMENNLSGVHRVPGVTGPGSHTQQPQNTQNQQQNPTHQHLLESEQVESTGPGSQNSLKNSKKFIEKMEKSSSSQQVVELKGPGSQELDTRRHGASTIQLDILNQGVSTGVSRSARTSVTSTGYDYADSVIASNSGIGSGSGPGSGSGSVSKSRSMSGRGIALERKDSSADWMREKERAREWEMEQDSKREKEFGQRMMH